MLKPLKDVNKLNIFMGSVCYLLNICFNNEKLVSRNLLLFDMNFLLLPKNTHMFMHWSPDTEKRLDVEGSCLINGLTCRYTPRPPWWHIQWWHLAGGSKKLGSISGDSIIVICHSTTPEIRI